MKFLFLALLLVGSLAQASGSLIAGGYYLDNTTQSVSPSLGLGVKDQLPVANASYEGYLGGGYILLPADVNGNVPNGYYGELKADVYYAFNPTLKLGVGGGLVTNQAAFQSFDNYVHVTLGYKLW